MQVPLGDFGVAVELRDDLYIAGRRAAVVPDLPDIVAALRNAFEVPRNFPPLRRALTPDDRVAVVVDEQLPQPGALVGATLEYLTAAGVAPAAITLVSAHGSRQDWVDDLPDAVQDVRTEIHDPKNRQALSYLASTRGGRRVYLNRSVVEADQTVVLAACRYDAGRVRDAVTALFPMLSDADTLRANVDRNEATEVLWLLGAPFLVQVIEGHGENAAHILGGTVESVGESERLLADRWSVRFDRPAQTVVAMLTGDPVRHDFATLARAAESASRVVESGGRIVLLTRATPDLGEAAQLLRSTDDPAVAARRIQEHPAPDQSATVGWLETARHARLYLLSGLDDDIVEELFATPMQQARQTQRLLDVVGSCLFIEDAHRVHAVIE